MHFLAATVFPQSRIWLVEQFHGTAAERLQPLELLASSLTREPAIEELLGGGQHDGAIDIVLNLQIGLVADANRAHAAISG